MHSHKNIFYTNILRIAKMNLWNLIFIIFFIIYGNESCKLRANIEEIFGNGWDKNESEESLIKMEQNEKNAQNEQSAVDQISEGNENGPNDQQKSVLVQKFDTIIEKLREKGKYHWENRVKIESTIGKLLGTNRQKIYKWKKELNLNKNKIMEKNFYEQKKKEFIERFDEFKSLYGQGKQKEFVKELGISKMTFIKWKKELMPNYNKTSYSNEDKLRKMKQYFKIKEINPKISDKIIAEKLGISFGTLNKWKKASFSN